MFLIRSCLCVAALWAVAVASTFAQAPPSSSEPPVSFYGVVPGDTTGVQGLSSTDQGVPAAVDAAKIPKRTELVIAPLPMVNPTLENGLAVVGGVLYRLDATDLVTAPSLSGVAAFKTSNGSWGAAYLQSLRLAHDKVRLMGVAAYGDVNYAYYGIGQSAGDAGLSIELNQAGPAGMVEVLVLVAPRWYIGARYQMLHMTVASPPGPIASGPTLPSVDADIRTAALGPRVEFDSRDNPFYPRRGAQLQGVVSFYGEGVGGQRSYQSYQAWLNRYHRWDRATCWRGTQASATSRAQRLSTTSACSERARISAATRWASIATASCSPVRGNGDPKSGGASAPPHSSASARSRPTGRRLTGMSCGREEAWGCASRWRTATTSIYAWTMPGEGTAPPCTFR